MLGYNVRKMICQGAGRLEMELASVFGHFDDLACFRAQSICSRYIGWLEGGSRSPGLEHFPRRTLTLGQGGPLGCSLQVQALRFELAVVRRTMIYQGIRLQGVGRRFLLCDKGCTTLLGGRSLGLLAYRVVFVWRGGRCDSRSLDGFRMVPTRIYGCLVVHL